MVCFKEAAQLNKAECSCMVWLGGIPAFVFVRAGKYGDLLDFVVLCLIFYILTIYGFYFT
jgi:hypothetical protein